jgi:predicted nucleotidyltransferase
LAKLQSDLNEFVGLLNSHRVEFVVVGGHAVAFHGHPRFTGDIDLLIRPTRENAEAVLRVLRDFGFDTLKVDPADLTTPGRILQLGRPPNRIDLLTSISAVTFDEAWETRISGALDDQQVSFLGWDALIRNKTASGRDKDRLDVKRLLAIAAHRRTDS